MGLIAVSGELGAVDQGLNCEDPTSVVPRLKGLLGTNGVRQ